MSNASALGSVVYKSGFKNKIINGNFGINQRSISGTVVLSAGAYGHDRFKAGASGCTYTFATSANVTTLTISAGSLQQVIEGLNLQSGTHVLTWTGTAQGKIGAGAYSASGVTGSATGGANLAVEFGTGTLSLAQLELSGVATPFDHRPYGVELALCLRYFQMIGNTVNNEINVYGYHPSAGAAVLEQFQLAVEMRATPIVTKVGTWTVVNTSQPVIAAASKQRFTIALTTTAGGMAQSYNAAAASQHITADAEL